jgi:hypothetical protein
MCVLFDSTDTLLEDNVLMFNEVKIETSAMTADNVILDGADLVYTTFIGDISLVKLLDRVSQRVLKSLLASCLC